MNQASDYSGIWSEVLRRDATLGQALAEELFKNSTTYVLDVGARDAGLETQWWRLKGFAGYFGFEPDKIECAKLNSKSTSLQAPSERYFPVALAESRGERKLYITSDPACSSLYEPDDDVIKKYPDLAAAKQVREISVPVVTLDEWWTENKSPNVSFLKIDTQGSEFDILRGGLNILDACVGAEIEVEFSPIYKNQPLFPEIDVFMRSRGFTLWRLYGLTHYPRNVTKGRSRLETIYYGSEASSEYSAGAGRLFWGNAVYFRDPDSAFYDKNCKQLAVVLALLEALGDFDGVQCALDRLVSEHHLPKAPANVDSRLSALKDMNTQSKEVDELTKRLQSALIKAERWDKFRGTFLGRLLGRGF